VKKSSDPYFYSESDAVMSAAAGGQLPQRSSHETLEAIMSMGKMAVLVFGFLVLTLVIATLATIPPS
jgi:hypothetical protein